jgi:hypothetical protein
MRRFSCVFRGVVFGSDSSAALAERAAYEPDLLTNFAICEKVTRREPPGKQLVHCLAYNSDVVRQAPDQLAVFQGASEAPHIGIDTGRASNAEKQPTGRDPEGGVENGPAAVRRPPDRLRIDLDMRPPTASPARTVRPRPDRWPILNATTSLLYARRCTSRG